MRVIPPFPIQSVADWTCNIPENATSWSGATTYALDQIVKINLGEPSLRSVYISLAGSNLNHSPEVSPTWWKFVGYQYQPYNVADTYAVGDIVVDTTSHHNYSSLVAGNIGNLLTDTTKWFDIGPSNSTSAFDLTRSTKTKADIPLVFTIRPVQSYSLNSLALFGLWATSVRIQMAEYTAPTTYLYDNTVTLTPTYHIWLAYNTWWTGANGPLYKDSIVIWDLPVLEDPIITITVTNTDGYPNQMQTRLGSIVLGDYVDLGGAEYGALNDSINFSTVNRAFDGSIDSIVKRRSIPRNNYTTYAPSTSIDELHRLRQALNAEAAAWFGITDYTATQFDSLAILGFYKRFTINIDQQDRVRIDLEVEES
jgi:hypothetical protein